MIFISENRPKLSKALQQNFISKSVSNLREMKDMEINVISIGCQWMSAYPTYWIGKLFLGNVTRDDDDQLGGSIPNDFELLEAGVPTRSDSGLPRTGLYCREASLLGTAWHLFHLTTFHCSLVNPLSPLIKLSLLPLLVKQRQLQSRRQLVLRLINWYRHVTLRNIETPTSLNTSRLKLSLRLFPQDVSLNGRIWKFCFMIEILFNRLCGRMVTFCHFRNWREPPKSM